MTKFLHVLNTSLLAGILAVLVMVLLRMPITLADLKNAKGKDRQTLLLRQSSVHMTEPISVEIANTSPLSVEIANTSPLSVQIENTPLSVEIDR
jgi:hypothetical protein